jgi:hypothetical protein
MRRWSSIFAVIGVLILAYVAGVPAPATVTVDHCYVTYDRLEQQHSRCVGHWTRLPLHESGPIAAVPVSQQWQALTTDPDANYEWEVVVPETARSYSALAVLTRAWVLPWPVQVVLTALSVLVLGGLAWVVADRLRHIRSPRGSMPEVSARR